MQLEVAAVEQVHAARLGEAVGDDGYAAIGDSLIAAVKLHIVHVHSQLRAKVDIFPSHVVAAKDHVHLAARQDVDVVDRLLHLFERERADGVSLGREPLIVRLVQAVKGAARSEDGFQTGYLVFVAALNGEKVGGDDAARDALVESDALSRPVHGGYAQPGHARLGRSFRAHDVHDHAFGEVARVVHGQSLGGRGGRRRKGGELAAAVAEEHPAQVELGRLQKPFHFRIEQVDEGALGGERGAHRLVRDLDPAVKVFQIESEALVVIARSRRQRARLRSRAHAAVHAVRDHLDYLLSPNVRARLRYLCQKGVDPRVELFRHDAEIIIFQRLFRGRQTYHIRSSFL